ncbi:MAG: hypothetical protein ACR2Q4_01285 [Geminicoccaceae bacterium]
MRDVGWILPLLALWASIGGGIQDRFAEAGSSPSAASAYGNIDIDPLRGYVPRADLYMPVPGGVYAVTDTSDLQTIEEQEAQRHGGIIVGYCLKASCRRVTHLVVIQVCSGKIGGPDGTDYLTLGVVRLPYGKTAGFVKSLQGRDYAYNFEAFGPFEQILSIDSAGQVEALYALDTDGAGPVEPLDYLGQMPKQPQRQETLALNLTMFQNETGTSYPFLQVRHLCEQPVS